jgi:nucleoside-diphosphate-sugar epimerase
MKILLIGGSGLTGPSAAAWLHERGHGVTVFHRGKTPTPEDVELIIGDRQRLGDYRSEFERRKFDVVVDFIVTSGAQAMQLMNTFCGIAGRVVALSSGDVYRAMGVLRGTEPGPLQPLPLTEDSDLRTKPHYSAQELKMLQQWLPYTDDNYEKIAVEKCVLGDPQLPGTVLRLPMVYGPGDYIHRFHYLLKRMDDRRPIIIFSDDTAAWRTPRGYAENVGAAIALAATSERAAGRIYNICEPEAFTELEWAKKIAKAVDWQGEFVVLPREKAPKHLQNPRRVEQHLVASSMRIREELGYQETISVEEGIRRTIPWERANPPQQGLSAPFDYEAEDAAIKDLRATA